MQAKGIIVLYVQQVLAFKIILQLILFHFYTFALTTNPASELALLILVKYTVTLRLPPLPHAIMGSSLIFQKV